MKSREGLDSYVTKEFAESGICFSGGELQKLAMARVFASNPNCIILDEATCHMDSDSENKILSNLFKEFQEAIIILIFHNNDLKKFVNKVFRIKEGSFVIEKIPNN